MPGPGAYRLPSDFGYYESAKITRSTMIEGQKEEVILSILLKILYELFFNKEQRIKD